MSNSHGSIFRSGWSLLGMKPLSCLSVFSQFFIFGVKLGIRSFSATQIRKAGLKRAVGFCLQPIENWSRYPELMSVFELFPDIKDGDVILDVSSPKNLGFFLANRYNGRFIMTDIWDVAIKEVEELASATLLAPHSSIELALTDALNLSAYRDNSIDVIFSASVVEHIEPQDGFERALKEFVRVLKPDGECLVTVPIRSKYDVEHSLTPVYGKKDSDASKVFFSHYYDLSSIQEIVAKASNMGLVLESVRVISWRESWLPLRLWRLVPQKIRGLFGIINLAISPWSFQISDKFPKTIFEVAGDVVLKWQKKVV